MALGIYKSLPATDYGYLSAVAPGVYKSLPLLSMAIPVWWPEPTVLSSGMNNLNVGSGE